MLTSGLSEIFKYQKYFTPGTILGSNSCSGSGTYGRRRRRSGGVVVVLCMNLYAVEAKEGDKDCQREPSHDDKI